MAETGRARSINRHRWEEGKLHEALDDSSSAHARILSELKNRIQIRQRQEAFHPNATQYTLQLEDGLFGVWRQNQTRSQSILRITSAETKVISLSELNMMDSEDWFELLSDQHLADCRGQITLEPYQSVWITNRTT